MSERSYRYLLVDDHVDGTVRRILLNRPDARNAQSRGLLVELGEAFAEAEADDTVRVIVLGGVGPVFSAGHDLGTPAFLREMAPGPDQHVSFGQHGGTMAGAERMVRQEWEHFFDNTRRWRDLRKITIAQVQGPVIAAGLMLMWACDLIVAADDATFVDVGAARLGMCGVEYFAHPWELGPRRAKELLLTGDSIDADEAHAIGMVSKVFPRSELEDSTLRFAERIARVPSLAALLVKEAVNQTVDNMGFTNALRHAFSLHQLNHAYWMERNEDGYPVARPEHGVIDWHSKEPIRPARKGAV